MIQGSTRRAFLVAALSARASTRARSPTHQPREASLDHELFATLLRRYVHAAPDGINRVDYKRWKASREDLLALQTYISELQRQDVHSLTRAVQFAYWVNLYNAETLRIVLGAYPVRSILAIRPGLFSFGPWKKRSLSIAGVPLSLDDLEHQILRPQFRDARVHYALNCASLGCPNLRREPWRGANLDADLDAAARAFVNHPRGVRQVVRGVRLSSIYKWYRADFGGEDAAVLAHIRRYAAESLQSVLTAAVRIAGYGYDWRLNDAEETSQLRAGR
jgi:hypothetical protein